MTSTLVSNTTFSSYSKVCLLGSRGVGKTSLLSRILNLPPSEDYLPTIGIRVHNLDVKINDEQQYFQFWDVSGNEIYHSLLPSVAANAGCLILVFDHQNTESQEEVMTLFEKIRELVNTSPILVVGNKAEHTKQEVPKMMEAWAQERKLRILPMSAKHGMGASLLLKKILQAIRT